MTRVARAAYFLAPPLVCLILFWRILSTWFLNDDFAWLGVPLEVHRVSDLWNVLFTPRAQGTVRFLSDRLFFLVFSSLFGFHAVPYRLWVLATWFAALTLANLIGARLTGSRAAGLLAALVWTVNLNVLGALAWASAYNEVLCAFCMLAAFYSRLRWLESGARRWMISEWAAYLAGFGALEIIVMYPCVALLHALCMARKRVWSTLPLFVPAAIFSIIHFTVIPKSGGPYKLALDHRLPATFWNYLLQAIGPMRLGDLVRHGRRPGLIITASIGVALLGFALRRLRRGELLPVFCIGWFVLVLAPVLPLPQHVTDYYVTVPLAGLAWLGGWAVVAAWRAGSAARAIAILLLAAYLGGEAREIDAGTRWYRDRSARVRVVVLAAEKEARAHPGSTFLLKGVDEELFHAAIQDDPFHLFGVWQVYLVPGDETIAGVDPGELTRFLISPRKALDLIEHRQAIALDVSPGIPYDITAGVETALRANPAARRIEFVDASDPIYAAALGPSWYPAETGYRWMPKTATVKMSGPVSREQRLYVTGFAPGALLASGPVTLHFRADGHDLGSAKVVKADEAFSFQFALPAELVGRDVMEISVEANKVFQPPGDGRDLGMAFGTFAVK